MRRIPLSLATLSYTVACAAACSSSPTPSSTTTSAEPPASSPTASASGPSLSRSLSLTGDGHTLRLDGAPADPSYVATYPIAGFTAMSIVASSFGDLTATCASGGSAVACKSLPFFAEVGTQQVKVYDAYGHVVMATPFPSGFDAGALPIPVPPPVSWDAGIGLGLFDDAGTCAVSVTASLSACSLTVGSVTCDCSDASCAASAIESCLSAIGVPTGGAGGGLGAGGLGGILPDDGGLPGIGWLDDAGPFSAACSSTAIASAKAQFCSDVDTWLTTNGVSATLDCAAIGTLTFPTTLPAPSTTGFTCDQITQAAFVKVRTELATCDPLDYIGWDSSAQLQLFEDSACTVW